MTYTFGKDTLQNNKDIKKILPGFRRSFLLEICWSSVMTHIGKTPRDHEVILGVLPKHRLVQQLSSNNDRLNPGNIFLVIVTLIVYRSIHEAS